jgi:hypothetical protein
MLSFFTPLEIQLTFANYCRLCHLNLTMCIFSTSTVNICSPPPTTPVLTTTTHKKLQKLRGTLLHTNAYSLIYLCEGQPKMSQWCRLRLVCWVVLLLVGEAGVLNPIVLLWYLDHLDNWQLKWELLAQQLKPCLRAKRKVEGGSNWVCKNT